jgi:hypothetical protein
MTGAPGSKWSLVAKSIYFSKDLDHSDYNEGRIYNSSNEKGPANHIGAYWDPGMEFESHQWDEPFSGTGIRLIKSHTFSHDLFKLKDSGYPIILVYRNDYECLNHWLKAGGFNITYPDYSPYYKNVENMWLQIKRQNRDIMDFIWDNKENITEVNNNYELCDALNITNIGAGSLLGYMLKDIKVYVYG